MAKSLRLHCVYCGATSELCTHILYAKEPAEIQAMRLAFEAQHDAACGPKSVGMIIDLPTPAAVVVN